MRFVTVDGRRMRYRTAGVGTPVVLLHGIGRSLEDWDEQLDALSREHEVHAVDLAGFGWSDPTPAVSLEAVAGHVVGFLDAVFGTEQPVHLVGNSLGGAVAMQVAALDPGRAASLVLLAPAGFGRRCTRRCG